MYHQFEPRFDLKSKIVLYLHFNKYRQKSLKIIFTIYERHKNGALIKAIGSFFSFKLLLDRNKGAVRVLIDACDQCQGNCDKPLFYSLVSNTVITNVDFMCDLRLAPFFENLNSSNSLRYEICLFLFAEI